MRNLLGLFLLLLVRQIHAVSDFVILFVTNETFSSLIANRSVADDSCWEDALESFNCSMVSAVLLFNGQGIENLAVLPDVPVINQEGYQLAPRFDASLLSADLTGSFPAPFWTGIDTTGYARDTSTCFNWQANARMAKGNAGWTRLFSVGSSCEKLYRLLCACSTATASFRPTSVPTRSPSQTPSKTPSRTPSKTPSRAPSKTPTTSVPTKTPTTSVPTKAPTFTQPQWYIQGGVPEVFFGSQIAAGDGFTCAMRGRSTMYCWGRNDYGQATPQPFPIYGSFTPTMPLHLSAGSYHTCWSEYTSNVWCWGRLPGAPPLITSTPQRFQLLDSSKIVKLDAGMEHTCAITEVGRVYCWGRCSYGQCGSSSDIMPWHQIAEFTSVPGKLMLDVAVGGFHTCVVQCGGGISRQTCINTAIYCRGPDTFGQGQVYPNYDRWIAVTAGMYHSCGLTKAGVGVCWGSNEYRQLGIGRTSNEIFPNTGAAPGSPQLLWIEAGMYHTCGLTYQNKLYCWGRNSEGQIGMGNFAVGSTLPQPIVIPAGNYSYTNIHSLSLGMTHTCIGYTMGSLRCWGGNEYGQLGDGTRTNTNQLIAPLPTNLGGSTKYYLRSIGSSRNQEGGFYSYQELQKECTATLSTPLSKNVDAIPLHAIANTSIYEFVNNFVNIFNAGNEYIGTIQNILEGTTQATLVYGGLDNERAWTMLSPTGYHLGVTGCYWNTAGTAAWSGGTMRIDVVGNPNSGLAQCQITYRILCLLRVHIGASS